MENGVRKNYKIRAEFMKALAHPTRLFIVEFLASGEKCVCEIVSQLNVDVSTISKHLLVMKNAGIVEDEKRGLKVFYKLTCPCILKLFNCIDDARQK